MADWYTVRVVKPIRIFQVRVNEEFSIYEKTGLKIGTNWKSPYILYCYRELISSEFEFDGKLILNKISSDRYKFTAMHHMISHNSILDVVVIESDEIGNTTLGEEVEVKAGDWKTLEKLTPNGNSYKLVTANASNDYTIDLSDMTVKPETIRMCFFIESMIYKPECYHIKITPEKLSDYKYKIRMHQKFCDKIVKQPLTGVMHGNQTVTLTNAGTVEMLLDGEAGRGFAEVYPPESKYFRIYIDGKEVSYSVTYVYMDGGDPCPYHCFVYPFRISCKDKTKSFVIEPIEKRSSHFGYKRLMQYSTTTGNFHEMQNFSMKVLVWGEVR